MLAVPLTSTRKPVGPPPEFCVSKVSVLTPARKVAPAELKLVQNVYPPPVFASVVPLSVIELMLSSAA